MQAKPWYQSLTLWSNILGGVLVILQYLGTLNVLNPELLSALLVLVNILLRFKTNQPVKLT